MIDLSIIILSYNTKELLKKCLESVVSDLCLVAGKKKSQTLPTTNHQPSITEIIVVDNASTDGSVGMVEKFQMTNDQFPIKLIKNKENLGFAKGNNVGLGKAGGRYILFLNSDTEVFPGSLSEAVEFMEKNPDVGVLTPKTMLASGKMDPDCHRGFPTPWASITYFLGLEKLFPKSRIFGQYHKFYLDLDENHETDAGAGAFMMIRKETVEKVGEWDESYFFYGEDLDYYYRIKQAGLKVMFYAKPLLLHYKGASSGLRKESKDISGNSKENRIKVAEASVEAMEIFYKKFYKNLYPSWLTSLVLTAIKVKGSFRILKHKLQ